MGNIISISGAMLYTAPASPYDADALAFFNAVVVAGGSLTSPQKDAVNSLVLSFKANGTWALKVAIYPVVGGTAAAHKINLKSPGTYDLTYTGGITHSATGMLFDGSSGFANTGAAANVIFDTLSAHMTYYSRTTGNAPSPSSGYDMGCSSDTGGTSNSTAILCRFSDNKNYAAIGSGAGAVNTNIATGAGCYIASQLGSTTFLYIDGYVRSQANQAVALPAFAIYIGANDGAGTANLFSARECCYADLGSSHTAAQIAADYTAIQAYETALSRQIAPLAPPSSYDADAQAYFDAIVAAGSSLTTPLKDAVNTLVIALKADGTWPLFYCLYPLVGGEAISHSFNLKNPAQYRITFGAACTHSSLGVAANNDILGTGLNPISVSLTTKHLAAYCLTVLPGAFNSLAGSQAGNRDQILELGSNNCRIRVSCDYNDVPSTGDSLGFYIANRVDSDITFQISGITYSAYTRAPDSADNSQFVLGSTAGFPSGSTFAFGSFGEGLTATQLTDYYTAVQAFQTTVGRASTGIYDGLDLETKLVLTYLLVLGIVLSTGQIEVLNQWIIDAQAAGIQTTGLTAQGETALHPRLAGLIKRMQSESE